MTNKTLVKNLSRLGFPLMMPEEELDVNRTLADVVKSHDPRLWEGFPVVLMNAVKDNKFNFNSVASSLNEADRKRLHSLVLLSLTLYKYYHLSPSWMGRFKENLTNADKNTLNNFRKLLDHHNSVNFAGMDFQTDRLKKTFELYFEKEAENSKQKKEKDQELSLEYSLSQMFSPRQKELLKKKLEGLSLTKTEREYYSRTVKKKVVALANAELHRLAQQLSQR